MTSDDPSLSIVLPCYNEARSLPALLEGYAAALPAGLAVEVICVDNGSTDDTPGVLAEQLARPDRAFVRVVRVPANVGYGHGLMAGLRAARGAFLAFSHADLQCPPADVFRAHTLLAAQDDPQRWLVKGRRSWRGVDAFLLTAGMSLVATSLLGLPLFDSNAQPKVFHRSLLERLTAPPDGFQLDLYVLYTARRAGIHVLTIPVHFGAREHGTSRWAFSLASRRRHIADMLRFIVDLRAGRVR